MNFKLLILSTLSISVGILISLLSSVQPTVIAAANPTTQTFFISSNILSNSVRITGGGSHTCAITARNGVECWGSNAYGQLGDGTTTSSSIPVSVNSLTQNVASIAAGRDYTCALTVNGGVKCWGVNDFGQLGNGTTDLFSSVPTDVNGLTSGVTAIATGGDHACALLATGKMKCWGRNVSGTLGDGTTTTSHTPVDVIGLSDDITAIAAGTEHTCALSATSKIKCWGVNEQGQLGNGTLTPSITPVSVSNLISNVSTIVAGGASSCALLIGGRVSCWGNNAFGQLGDDPDVDQPTPVDLSGLISDVSTISVGGYHMCAVTISSGVKCWGNGYSGQLGNNTNYRSSPPVDVSGLVSGVIAVTTGDYHSCAMTIAYEVKCWGRNDHGELGDGPPPTSPGAPSDVIGLSSNVTAIASGAWHTCALTNSHQVKCWGENDYGQLGNGTNIKSSIPVDVNGLPNDMIAISAGMMDTCAVTGSGGVKCWGWNYFGQLGNGETETWSNTPVDVSGLISGVTNVAAGYAHTCALTNEGRVKCWGSNSVGQLGNGTATSSNTPIDAIGLTSVATAIAAGKQHMCVITTSGRVECWGGNFEGELGDGTYSSRTAAAAVNDLPNGVTAISADYYHSCAVLADGKIKCWGGNYHGQLGDGTSQNIRNTPVYVDDLTSTFTSVAAGYTYSCAAISTVGVKCWGYDMNAPVPPTEVTGLNIHFTAIAAGWEHTCALTDLGGVKCWGSNEKGQLGNGKPGWSLSPVDVIGFNTQSFYLPFIVQE